MPGCVSCGADSRGRGGALRECTVPERARERQCRHADDEPHRCGVLLVRVCAGGPGPDEWPAPHYRKYSTAAPFAICMRRLPHRNHFVAASDSVWFRNRWAPKELPEETTPDVLRPPAAAAPPPAPAAHGQVSRAHSHAPTTHSHTQHHRSLTGCRPPQGTVAPDRVERAGSRGGGCGGGPDEPGVRGRWIRHTRVAAP